MNSSNGTSVAKVREAVEKVLAQESYKKKPIEMEGAIARSHGIKRAADIRSL
ncbi:MULTISPECIES: hypothetical protein [unclassified Microcoleus]